MSYLDNLISGKSEISSLSRPSTPGATRRNSLPNNAPPRAGSAPVSDAASVLKRKATADLTKDMAKNPRTDSAPRTKDGVNSRPGSSAGVKVQAAQGISAERKILGGGQAVKKPTEPSKLAASVPPAASRPLAKGSFAEIMARAKNNVDKAKDPGLIKHKTFEKKHVPRKEQAKGAKKREPSKDASKSHSTKDSGRNRTAGQHKGLKSEKMARKPPQSTYQGTSRQPVVQSTYKGTANIKSVGSSRTAQSSKDGSHKAAYPPVTKDRSRYDEYEDESEDEYYSDASSDMEAGVLDIEMEEEAAMRAAKAEDEAALREEREHRRLKDERKHQGWE